MRPVLILVLLLVLAPAASAHPGSVLVPKQVGRADLASVQAALSERNLYRGAVDGMQSADTRDALSQFQLTASLPATGLLTPETRKALDADATPATLTVGARGLRVASLQFRLAWHGFPSGPPTTVFTKRVESAVKKFQAWAGLTSDGVPGALTLKALSGSLPSATLPLAWPVDGPVGDLFGPRIGGFHTGLDIAAPTGTGVRASADGVVIQSGMLAGGWGRAVTIDHGDGITTIYAHLSVAKAKVGQQVAAGSLVGLVGATGDATGPHLHFEEELRGAAFDPLPSLPPSV